MAEWVDIPLATQQAKEAAGISSTSTSYVSEAELVNLRFARNPPGTRTAFYVRNTDGLGADTGPGSGIVRGLCRSSDGKIWAIRGTTAYYSSDGGQNWSAPGVTSVGASGTFYRMIDAGTHVAAVNGVEAYAIDTSGATAASRGNFIDATYQDGRTVYAETSSDSIYSSDADTPGTIDALNFTTADAQPGNVLAVISDHREIFAFKDGSIEHYYNAGASGFPFVRSAPGLVEVGLYGDTGGAFHTAAKYDNSLFWLSRDMRAYTMRGLQPTPISTPWVERYMFANTPAPSAVGGATLFGAAYVLSGTLYYMVSGFREPSTGQRTALVYNATDGVWHRQFSPLGTTYLITHAVDVPAGNFTSDRVLVAVYNTASQTSTLRYMTDGSTGDSGASGETTRTMTLPQFAPGGGRRVFMHELELDMQKPSTTGTITLSWSDDGGSTYSSGVTATGGDAVTRFQRLGSFRQRILRLTFSIASRIAIMGVRARISVGA